MIRKAQDCQSEQRPAMKGGPGTVTMEHFFKKDEFGGTHVRVCSKLVIPPGVGIGLHQHLTEDEVYVVLKGRGIVNDNGVSAEIGPGDAVLTGKGESHAVTCLGDETLEILALVVTY